MIYRLATIALVKKNCLCQNWVKIAIANYLWELATIQINLHSLKD